MTQKHIEHMENEEVVLSCPECMSFWKKIQERLKDGRLIEVTLK